MKSTAVRRFVTVVLLIAFAAAVHTLTLEVGAAQADETVIACGPYFNPGVFAPVSNPPVIATAGCPGKGYGGDGNGLFLSNGPGSPVRGQNALWQANTPAGLTIVQATVPELGSFGVNAGNQGEYGGDFYWAGGASNIMPIENSFASPAMSSGYFGIQLVCGLSTCAPNNINPTSYILAQEVSLSVRETSGPWVTAPTGLWQANGWVRGNWPLFVWGNSPSGLCGIVADFNYQTLPGTTSARDQSTWHQCAAGPIQDTVNTPGYSDGANSLHIGGWDAAGETVDDSKIVYVDNQQPTVSLSGPSDAPSSAGTQYVTATASAGPSGVAGISCAVDGGPAQWYPDVTAQVPVGGIGPHVAQCYSVNNAVDANGDPATSPLQTFSLSIRQPTVAGISFSRIVDGLRCHRVRERVSIPARWVTVHRDHRRVRVRKRTHTELMKVVKCHARTVRRRQTVYVRVRRRGKRVRVRQHQTVSVIVPPRAVTSTTLRVPYGQAATVNGWLGTDALTALGGEPVTVMTAPDNGLGQFAPATTAVTGADGSWSALLPAGPSRLVEAAYPGDPLTEPTVSSPVQVVVPAQVRLISVTRRVPWGGTVRIVGRLEGGYLPPGGALVRLRYGQGSQYLTYGVKTHVGGDGLFTTGYTFGAGDPAVYRSYFFQVASLPSGNYPFAPAASRRLWTIVGGHPAAATTMPAPRRRGGGHRRGHRHRGGRRPR